MITVTMIDLNIKTIEEIESLWSKGIEFIISDGKITGIQERDTYVGTE